MSDGPLMGLAFSYGSISVGTFHMKMGADQGPEIWHSVCRMCSNGQSPKLVNPSWL